MTERKPRCGGPIIGHDDRARPRPRSGGGVVCRAPRHGASLRPQGQSALPAGGGRPRASYAHQAYARRATARPGTPPRGNEGGGVGWGGVPTPQSLSFPLLWRSRRPELGASSPPHVQRRGASPWQSAGRRGMGFLPAWCPTHGARACAGGPPRGGARPPPRRSRRAGGG